MSNKKNNKKETKINKKKIVDLKELKALENLKSRLEPLDSKDDIVGGKDKNTDTVVPQWPTQGGQ